MKNIKFRQSIHAKPYVIVRNFLKEHKKQANLSNRKLGKKLNTTYSLVAKVESGDRRLDVVEACKYCKSINANPHELIDLIIKNLDD